MMSASHLPATPPASPATKRPRRSPRQVLAELGDVLWLGYYHLIDLAAPDGPRRLVPVHANRAKVRVLGLHGPLPHRSR